MQEKVKKFREALEPVRMTLKSQKYIGGDSPNYGDYCIISVILTGRAVSKLQVLTSELIFLPHETSPQMHIVHLAKAHVPLLWTAKYITQIVWS